MTTGCNGNRVPVVLLVGGWLLACAPKEAPPPPLGESATTKSNADATSAAPAVANNASPRRLVPQAIAKTCSDICDRSRQLRCNRADQCESNCVAMGSVTPCSDEFSSFFQCLLRQPLQNWECGDDGVAAIKEKFCDPEQGRAVTCMEAKMQR
jgi:hypothetical protein